MTSPDKADRPDAAGRPTISSCWSCRGPVGAGVPFCATCGAVQPPGEADHFARLGLARRFDLDLADLDRRYFGWSRQLHPDRFRTRSAKERSLSQAQAVSLNQAYETLKDPLRRAIYLLTLAGRRAPDGDSHTVSDPALLIEAMEAREALAEADSAAAVEGLAAANRAAVADCIDGLAAAFGQGDLDAAERVALRLKYRMKFAEEARSRRVRLGAAA